MQYYHHLQSIHMPTVVYMVTLFKMIIVGMTACGKTDNLLKMLERDDMNLIA